ncbi:MAG: peptide chain release factor N(5)-glutamine methyltransferase [Mycobacteriales bacterium]
MTAGAGAAVSVRAAVAAAADQLAAAGVASPGHDARALAAHALGIEVADLVGVGDWGAAEARYRRLVQRRAGRTPLQHLVGRAPFRHLDLAVGPGVFVPRPETELLVDWVLGAASDGALCVDLCAGSGALGLALAQELAGSRVHLVERSAGAFGWLARNAEARAAAGDPPVELHLADAATALPQLDGRVDVVVSNPPYLTPEEVAGLEPEVRDGDPWEALVAGATGLEALAVVVSAAGRLLRPGGLLVMEHADRHGALAVDLVRAAGGSAAGGSAAGGWVDVADHPDLAGWDRFVTAVRR